MNISEKLNAIIAENNGSARDALNVTLAHLDLAVRKIASLEAEKAAAPELLEACEAFVNYSELPFSPGYKDALEKCKSAIAKARGEG